MDTALMQQWVELGNGLGLNATLGVRVGDVNEDETTATVPLDDTTRNHVGTLHAVALAGAAELASAMMAGVALGDLVDDGLIPVQAGFRVRYRRPATAAATAHATVAPGAADAARTAHAAGERPHLPVDVIVRVGDDDVAEFAFDVVFVPFES